ncbi:meiotic recombination protein SPO11-like [Schistocerca gregaria]|uniref:meiotic recombination protein SPO11-like n=1 Tax=Schistocerca gregaria TaxID=7010 RepID=UPI00211EC6D6|nr:meiotic recombination protein SPO11-like [Schistocerca gregaria]
MAKCGGLHFMPRRRTYYCDSIAVQGQPSLADRLPAECDWTRRFSVGNAGCHIRRVGGIGSGQGGASYSCSRGAAVNMIKAARAARVGGRSPRKSALYYEQAGGARSQRTVDAAATDASRLLGAPAWRLGLLASGKALVAGPLLITTAEGGRIDCARAAAGQLVPQDVAGIRELRADSARLVLLVEKDAVFQKLLDQGVQQALGPCILLTGKGFPDVNARLFLRRLWDSLRLPVLALVDADPYGIEIMCVYRFGSLVQTLLTDDHKAEIEAVAGLSREYLVRGYLPNKIRCRDIV